MVKPLRSPERTEKTQLSAHVTNDDEAERKVEKKEKIAPVTGHLRDEHKEQ